MLPVLTLMFADENEKIGKEKSTEQGGERDKYHPDVVASQQSALAMQSKRMATGVALFCCHACVTMDCDRRLHEHLQACHTETKRS